MLNAARHIFPGVLQFSDFIRRFCAAEYGAEGPGQKAKAGRFREESEIFRKFMMLSRFPAEKN